MQKIILDTNILVSALISNSIPTKILYHIIFEKKVQNCISEQIFEEYVQVLNRDKFIEFKDFKIKADIVLSKLKEISKIYSVTQKVDVLKDKSDIKFLELAVECSAEFLITGNANDFKVEEMTFAP